MSLMLGSATAVLSGSQRRASCTKASALIDVDGRPDRAWVWSIGQIGGAEEEYAQ